MKKNKTEPNLITHSFDELIKGIISVPKEDIDNAVKRPNEKIHRVSAKPKSSKKKP